MPLEPLLYFMANTKLILDRQASAKTFSFGTTSASQQALVTVNNGTAAATNVVLDVKGALQLNTAVTGVLKAASGVVSGSASTTDLTEGTNLYYTDARVRLNRLDQMAAPTAAVAMNAQKITGLGAPTVDTDAATKLYVDATKQGLDFKDSVRAATAAAGTLASSFANASVIDGVTLATGDRILIKDQVAGADNGIYTVNATGAPTRATDADSSSEVSGGLYVFVESGTANADSGFVLTNDGAITLGTTALVFTQFSGAGQITAGAALTKTGNTLDVAVDGASIEVSVDALRVKAAGVTNAMLAGSIDLATKVTGALPVANGGTGQTTYIDGQLLIGNTTGNTLTKTTLTAGTGVTITNGSGAITIAATASAKYQRATAVTGTQDSVNKIFTIANALTADSEQVFLNGQLLTPGVSNDYVISTTTVTLQAAIDAPAATDVIRVYGDY